MFNYCVVLDGEGFSFVFDSLDSSESIYFRSFLLFCLSEMTINWKTLTKNLVVGGPPSLLRFLLL